MMQSRPHRTGICVLSLLALGACGPNPDAEMRTPTNRDSARANAQASDPTLRNDTISGMSMSTDTTSAVRPSGAPGTGGDPTKAQRKSPTRSTRDSTSPQ